MTHTTLQVTINYRDIDQKQNSNTKSLKNSLSQQRIRLLDSLWAWVSCAHSKENSLYPGRVETNLTAWYSLIFISAEIVT